MIIKKDIIDFFNDPHLRQYHNNINHGILWTIYNFHDEKTSKGNRIKSIDERHGFDISYYDDIGFHQINKIQSGRLYDAIKEERAAFCITKKMKS